MNEPGWKAELRSLAAAAEQEFQAAVACMNDDVVPELRRGARWVFAVSAVWLRQAADVLDGQARTRHQQQPHAWTQR